LPEGVDVLGIGTGDYGKTRQRESWRHLLDSGFAVGTASMTV